MKALSRIERVKRAGQYVGFALDVLDFTTQGRLAGALNGYVNRDELQRKQPATIHVKSERQD